MGLRAGGNSADVLVTNCIFYNNNYAIQVGYSSYEEGTVTVQNSIFIGNSIATRKYDSRYGYLSSLYSCFYDNTTNFSSGTAAGLGDITVDPKFEDITKSFILQSDSPGRDAGNPNAGYNDGDGSRNDMGVYGGPYSWGKGPVITDIAITPATINQGGAVTITATAKKN